MAFTKKEQNELALARATVKRLEVAEASALDDLLATLDTLGLQLAGWAAPHIVLANADAIRDALEPFDSGVRCKDESA